MTPVEILRAAKAKIEKPENWCKNTYILDRSCGPAYCARGAMWAASLDGDEEALADAETALCAAIEGMGYFTVVAMNDLTDHATVLSAFDRAISLAEQDSQP